MVQRKGKVYDVTAPDPDDETTASRGEDVAVSKKRQAQLTDGGDRILEIEYGCSLFQLLEWTIPLHHTTRKQEQHI